MPRTSLQKSYAIIRFCDQHVLAHGASSGTAAAIATAYSVVRAAKGREHVSVGFVDTALTVHNRLLSHAPTAQLLLDLDNRPRGENPFDSSQVLQNIISKGKTSQGIHWVMQGVAYCIQMKALQNRTCSRPVGSGAPKRPATVAWLTSSSSRRTAWDFSSAACLTPWGSQKGPG